MVNPEPSNHAPNVDSASLEAAREATQSALPFVEWLMQRFSKIVHQIRSGDDLDAMDRIAALTGDLGDFFQYTFLIEDLQATKAELQAYRTRLATILETINPALNDLDLVEVADIVEHDVLPALADYSPLHEQISASLCAA